MTMATPTLQLNKVLDSEIKKSRKRYEEENPKIRIGKDAHRRWCKFMDENQLKTHREAATCLLDRWYEKQTTILQVPVRPSPLTLHERNQPSTSTPVGPATASFQKEMRVPVSDITEGITVEDVDSVGGDPNYVFDLEEESEDNVDLEFNMSTMYPMYTARNQLAFIDDQKHKDRPHAVDAKGNLKYQRLYSKRKKIWVAVAVKEQKMYTYIPAMLQNIFKNFEEFKEPIPSTFPVQEDVPRLIKRNIVNVEPGQTKDLVEKKKSRFK